METNMQPQNIDQIDSTDYIVKSVRAIKRYLDERVKDIKDYKIPADAQGAKLQQEKAYLSGASDEINNLIKFVKTLRV